MALFAFVISGVLDGNSNSAGPTDPIAIINEEEMSLELFRFQVEQTERNYGFSTLSSRSHCLGSEHTEYHFEPTIRNAWD